MGHGSFSTHEYTARLSTRAASGRGAFEHTDDIARGKVQAACHPRLATKDVIVRESRDSAEHPNSTAVAVIFDVTGSMHNIPRTFQTELPELMRALTDGAVLPDPQILVGAIGDYTSRDRAPLQIGQFESSDIIDEDLSRIYLEGRGGGGGCESYELAAYFMARHTSLDCHEKRNKKGYLFMFGDEMAYDEITPGAAQALFSSADRVAQPVSTADIFAELKQKYNVVFCIPNTSANYRNKTVHAFWQDMMGKDSVLFLEDPTAIVPMITSAISLFEGQTLDQVTLALQKSNYSAEKQKAALDAVAPLVAQAAAANAEHHGRMNILRD